MNNSKILIVEDEIIVAKDIQRLLTDLGYESIICRYGEEVLSKARDFRPLLILMDIMLAGEVSGIDAAMQVREHLNIPVIFLSAFSNDELIHVAKKAHPYGYLVKPFDSRLLKITIDLAFTKHFEDRNVRKSEEKFRNIFENIQDIYFETQLDGKILEVSPSIKLHSDYERDEILGKNVELIYYYPQRRKNLLELLKTGGKIQDEEIILKNRGGEAVSCSLNATLVYNTAGEPERVVGTIRNIQGRKKIEEELKSSEERFRRLADMLPETIYESDSQGRITYVNSAAFKTFGYHPEDIEQRFTVMDFIAPQDRKRALENRKITLEENNLRRIEYIGVKKDGTYLPIMIHTAPILSGTLAGGTRGIVVDITELKKAQQEAENLLKEKETLLKEVHHRIKNNFQFISNILYLQSNYIEDPNVQEILKEAQSRVQYMALLHENFYRSDNVSVIGAEKYFKDLCSQLLESYATSQKKISIEVQSEPAFLDLHFAIQCGLIVNELVTNSLKYAFRDKQEGKIQVQFYQSQDHDYVLEVDDDGSGFLADPVINKPKTLGLDLVKSITESLSGQLIFESSENGGTKIKLIFSRKT